MDELLTDLGFVPLKKYLSLYNLSISPSVDVFIKYDSLLPNPDFTNRHSLSEVINHSIKTALATNPKNTIASGYCTGSKDKLICSSPNSTLNLIKTKDWEMILQEIGDELFKHILVDCTLVQVVNKNKILIAGTLQGCIEKKHKPKCISRNRLFFKGERRELSFDSKDFVSKVLSYGILSLKNTPTLFEDAFLQVENKYKKTKIDLIFKTFKFQNGDSKKDVLKEIEYKKVTDFLFCVSKKLFKGIFSYSNFKILKSKLSLLVSRNRFETLSEEELVSFFKIKQFPWARGIQNKEEYEFVQCLTKNTIFQLFEDFFIPLISTFFYSTESCYGKLKVFYFKRTCWYKFEDVHIKKFIGEMCRKKEKGNNQIVNSTPSHNLCRKKEKGNNQIVNSTPSHNLRCIPKKDGGRVIVNLSKSNRPWYSPNERLSPLYLILKEEMRHKLGNSALGYEDMFKLVYPFVNEFKRFYVLKLDLKKCFDNIPHSYLKNLIDSLYEKEYYCVKKFSTLGFKNSSLRLGKYHRILDINKPSDSLYKETVFNSGLIYKDDVYPSTLKRKEIIKSVHEMAFNNKIFFRNSVYVQNRGIPQGSIFSTLLCSLYLDKIDVKFFNRIIKKGKIVRYVDDYLILTPSLSEIKLFTSLMSKLTPVGINFNTKKVISNFNLQTFEKQEDDTEIIWCGLKLVTKGGRIGFKMDLKEKVNKYGVSYPSVSSGTTIFNRMKTFFSSRTPEILFSSENIFVYENIFDFFLLYKIRVNTLFSRAPFRNEIFYSKILDNSVHQMVLLCKRRRIRLNKDLIIKIAKQAFTEKKSRG